MDKLYRAGSRDLWTCDMCMFDNSVLLDNCQMCESAKPPGSKQPNKPIKEEILHKDIIKPQKLFCLDPSCRSQNEISQIKCKKCGKFLLKQLQEEQDQIEEELSKQKKQSQKQKMILCNQCKFQNDPNNFTCVNCDRKMKKKKTPKKPKVGAVKRRGPNFCQGCNSYKMYLNGQFSCNCPDEDDGKPIEKPTCNYCFTNLTIGKYDEHIQNCKEKQIFYDKNKNKSYERCTQLQINTIMYMHKKCEKLHFGKQKRLQAKIEKLGFTKKDLQNLYHYIVNYAPIIIHMHVNTHFQFFVKDTHYRSQFQTAKSSGSLSSSARTNWEDRMFDQMHHNATHFQRVKYGTMNFTNDPQGVAACLGYGQSYFLLKQHVRDRCTMTDMDSSSPSATICTFRFCYHLLSKLTDAQIRAAFEGSKANQIKSAGIISAYKQIQIHGPVQFKKDIERVYVSRAQVALNPACMKEVQDFCKNNGLDYQLFGQVPKPVAAFGAPGFMPGAPDSFALGGVPGGSFYPAAGSSLFLPSHAHYRAPIKYKSVSFPYSSLTSDKQKKDEDYI